MRSFLTTVLLLLPIPLAAQQVAFVCKLNGGNSGGYIADDVVIGLDRTNARAIVADGLTLYATDGPVEASIRQNTDKRLGLAWRVPLTNRGGQTTIMKYSGTLQFPSMRFGIVATPSGFQNTFTARGACQQTNQSLQDLIGRR